MVILWRSSPAPSAARRGETSSTADDDSGAISTTCISPPPKPLPLPSPSTANAIPPRRIGPSPAHRDHALKSPDAQRRRSLVNWRKFHLHSQFITFICFFTIYSLKFSKICMNTPLLELLASI